MSPLLTGLGIGSTIGLSPFAMQTLWSLYLKDLSKPRDPNTNIPAEVTTASPAITQSLAASRRRLAALHGRKSTLLSGGLLGNPSLLKQGLTV